MSLPPVRPVPCHECPWRRSSTPGYLGPYPAEVWTTMAHGEVPIACHTSIDASATNEDGFSEWDQEGLLQCSGAARFRANAMKLPREPDVAHGPKDPNIFKLTSEFMEHHT